MATKPYDAIIIGAGHNGLTCACYLADAGLKVHIVERRGVVGGAAVTEEFYPGFRNSTASYTVSLLNPRVIRDLRLADRGLKIIERPFSNFVPLEDGRYLKFGGELARTQDAVARFSKRDAAQLPTYYARLDRLASVKDIAQLGAVLGRAFPYELLQAVSPLDEPTLQRELGRLVEAELLYQRGVPPRATYTFKHALLQESAYQSLLKSTRQQYHQRVAQVLVERFPAATESRPEFVAHHYTAAGSADAAIGYWQIAGQRARARSAHVEAIAHLSKGLDLLETLPDSPERTQRALSLHLPLGASMLVTKGKCRLKAR